MRIIRDACALRYSALTHLAEAGRTAPELQVKSRHQHLASLGRYVRLDEETSARITHGRTRSPPGTADTATDQTTQPLRLARPASQARPNTQARIRLNMPSAQVNVPYVPAKMACQ
jgi:hypothetical protein